MSWVLKTKYFQRLCRREGVSDAVLLEAVARANKGLIDADLGGHLIKQRIARPGHGSRGGYRTLIAFKSGDVSIFLYCFPKNAKANIDDHELRQWQELAEGLLERGHEDLKRAVARGDLIEVAGAKR